ncbi:MAG TPA: long-chain fatty acid--CoA ligase [Nitrospiria bacterium]|nr:long-chain fatty acid--CoA ligase [Nitrospiria bacterium]
MSKTEKEQKLVDLCSSLMRVSHILERRADLTPHRIGCVLWESRRRFHFQELEERARKAARLLLDLGVTKGDRVVLLAQNGIHYVDLFFGIAKIGAIFVPINYRLAPPEIEYILSDCQPTIFFFSPLFEETIHSVRKRGVVPHWISLAGDGYEDALSTLSSNPLPFIYVDPENPHSILYTSGTTGRPKGVMLSHRMILWNSINTIVSWGLREDDIAPIFTPQFHSGGLNVLMVPLLYVGGRVIITELFRPPEALSLLEQERPTILFLVPTMFQILSEDPAFRTTDFSSLRLLISGGAPCPEKLMEVYRRRGLIFRQGYGLTEVGVNCFTMTNDESATHSGSVGHPIFHSLARIVNEEGKEVRSGEVGELILSGPHVSSGYWNNPQATAEAIKDGWFYTGDLAVEKEGCYYIVGRRKEMFISGGENIYPAEIETVLLSHPKIQDVAVIGIPDESWGEVGVAIVVLRARERAEAAEIQEFCRGKIAKFKIPKSVVFEDSLPRNAYGKIQREELRVRMSTRFRTQTG